MSTKYIESLNPLFDAAKKHAKKQKGLGYFVKLDAGNVEANVDAFNHFNTIESPSGITSGTAADGGTGAVASAGAVAESVGDDKDYSGLFYYGYYDSDKDIGHFDNTYMEILLSSDNNKWFYVFNDDSDIDIKIFFDTAKEAYDAATSKLKTIDNMIPNVILLVDRDSNKIEDKCMSWTTMWKDKSTQYPPMAEKGLEEAVVTHDTLNPKIWNSDGELIPEIKDGITEIANTFIEELRDDDTYINPIDILIVGSNASFNYNDDSDLDIHIITNNEDLDDDVRSLMPTIYDAYKSKFNDTYDISIKGIPTELYVEDGQTSVSSNGIYSISKGWIKKPVKVEPTADINDLLNDYKTEYEEVMASDDIQKIKDFLHKIYEMRKASILTDGEYGKGNLVFKELRNVGYIENLRNKRDALITKELTIAENKE